MRFSSNIDREFDKIDEYWSPRVIAEVNGQYVKIAKAKGELVWHAHGHEDEMFLIRRGSFGLRFRDGSEVILNEGDFYVVPKGVEHLPYSSGESWIILFEPASTKHTGDVTSSQTKTIEAQTAHLR